MFSSLFAHISPTRTLATIVPPPEITVVCPFPPIPIKVFVVAEVRLQFGKLFHGQFARRCREFGGPKFWCFWNRLVPQIRWKSNSVKRNSSFAQVMSGSIRQEVDDSIWSNLRNSFSRRKYFTSTGIRTSTRAERNLWWKTPNMDRFLGRHHLGNRVMCAPLP